ncbi:CGNR zinc finger domain-containing protein [Prauserella cavernicola]|uniref:CGNR zinc finger domain-containing protein n=1 Tax=Prauserella cavernicola TaxID=2800127 RepID=A0A934QT40_9PSEU|nr:CGNR zinc finger domain-containing protein [Prauserella cavernicola]MBK1786141.1 CGNR zinc finger domain-containing protein [Prauserella cavernicola]
MAFDGAQRAADLVAVLLRDPADPAEVSEVLLAHGEKEPLGLGGADVAAMRAVAPRLHAVFAATRTERAAELLNDLLSHHAAPPRLTTHGGEHPWHVHVDSADDAPWAEWLLASSAHALALLLAERQRPPGGLCASTACGRPFADLGGGSPRRYCSTRCATRERVAAHRRKGPA